MSVFECVLNNQPNSDKRLGKELLLFHEPNKNNHNGTL